MKVVKEVTEIARNKDLKTRLFRIVTNKRIENTNKTGKPFGRKETSTEPKINFEATSRIVGFLF
jgi:hypothetical protein